MKKGILLLLSCLFFGLNAMAVDVTGVTLAPTTALITIGDTRQLVETVLPTDATNRNVTWTSSNDAVATVSSTGLVTAVEAGNATITVTTVDKAQTATCVVTVSPYVHVTSVSISPSNLELSVGITQKLTATVVPSNAADRTVSWSSSNVAVATVSESGLVTAVSEGTTLIIVETNDQGFTDTCAVTVTPPKPVSGVTLDHTTASIVVGGTQQLIETIAPHNATNKKVSWSSSDDAVATVSESGLVTAVSEGTATITVTTEDQSKTAKCDVTVTPVVPVSEIVFDETTLSLNVDSIFILTAHVSPINATNKSVTFTISDRSIVDSLHTQDTIITIKAKSIGNAVITVTTSDGSKTAECNVIVPSVAVTQVKFNTDTVRTTLADTVLLTPVITPNNATDKSLIWTSTDTIVASVSTDGIVRPKTVGQTLIIATSNSVRTVNDTCVVIISAAPIPVDSVRLNADSLSIIQGDTIRLITTVYPDDASNKNITWRSLNPAIATVSNTGLITAVRIGTTSVIVTSDDGSLSDTCIINVRERIIFVDPITTTGRGGSFELSVNAPDDQTITGVFTIQFPTGISLDIPNTKLAEAYGSSILTITAGNNNTWTVEIKESNQRSMLRVVSNKKIMDIAYTLAPTFANGTYNITITDATFEFSDGSVIKEEAMNIKMTVDIETGNDLIAGVKGSAYMADNRLYVESASAETIYVYSFNGTLIYSNRKEEGIAVFDLNTKESLLIVKGSTGWVSKVAK